MNPLHFNIRIVGDEEPAPDVYNPTVYRGSYPQNAAPGDLYQNYFGLWYIVRTNHDFRPLTDEEVDEWVVKYLGLTKSRTQDLQKNLFSKNLPPVSLPGPSSSPSKSQPWEEPTEKHSSTSTLHES
jgi:hypothetical protein